MKDVSELIKFLIIMAIIIISSIISIPIIFLRGAWIVSSIVLNDVFQKINEDGVKEDIQ